jgi:putative colanic acid biosynthesis acetyltransferase WcaF
VFRGELAVELKMQTEGANRSGAFLDVKANRQARKYNSSETLRRVLWAFGTWLLRLSPRPCFGWRRFILRCFGARIGAEVHFYPNARVYFPWNLEVGDWAAIGEEVLIYNLGRVKIGNRATISHRAHLCAGTHDYARPDLPLLKEPITIGSQAWVCADAFIGPGVTVGDGAIVGARAVAVKDVAPWTIVAGNPARFIKKRELKST